MKTFNIIDPFCSMAVSLSPSAAPSRYDRTRPFVFRDAKCAMEVIS